MNEKAKFYYIPNYYGEGISIATKKENKSENERKPQKNQ